MDSHSREDKFKEIVETKMKIQKKNLSKGVDEVLQSTKQHSSQIQSS